MARKPIALATGLLLAASASGYLFWHKPSLLKIFKTKTGISPVKNNKAKNETLLRLSQKAAAAKNYIALNGFNTQYCFLIDMHIPSGQKRFFVYNLQKDSVEISGLVTHGSGASNNGSPVFSNTPNSNCTSLGKYKIGKPYYGKFGLAYKLYGLNSSNSKAFYRFVVLHSHECVPNGEVSPQLICESWGCPTVSPAFLTQLQTYIDDAPKPVMLWIYY